MSISTVAARLAKIQKGITGVRKAFDLDELPNSLKGTYLPCFVNVPGPATYEGWGSGDIVETRLWRMMLFVTPIQRPSDMATKAVMVQPFFRRVVAAFADAQQLDDLTDVQLAWAEGDDGLDVLEYAGELYAGVETRLTVKETWNTTVGT